MRWSIADIADAIEFGFRAEAEQNDREQVVRGFDALEEVPLHPLVQRALRTAGFGVYAEERFPAERHKRKKSTGQRCDIVLTPENRALATPESAATLFDPPQAVALREAFWLEIKVVAQFTGDGEPNARYSSSLLEPVRQDVAKLAADPEILHAGILLMMFVADKYISEHDLVVWQARCVAGGYPISSPVVRQVRITDRIGHGFATFAIFQVPHL